MKTVFGYDGPLMTLLMRFWNLVWLTLLTLLCSIPLFTAGAAYSALYYTIRKAMAHERGYVTPTFFGCIRDNWRQTLPAGLGFLVVGIALVLDYQILDGALEAGMAIGNARVVPIVIGVVLLLYGLWLFAYICRFQAPLRQILQNSALIAASHMGKTLLCGLILAVGALVCYLEPILVAVVPGLAVWLISKLTEGVFRQYMTEEQKAQEDERAQEWNEEALERRQKLRDWLQKFKKKRSGGA